MWARVVEVMVGAWLMTSPFILQHSPGKPLLWVNDIASGFVVAVLALLSFHPKLEYAHWLSIVLGIWLAAVAFLAPSAPPPASYQNNAVCGLLIIMLALMPSWSFLPPPGWREEARHEPGD